MTMMANVRRYMHREPIIAWSCIIGGIGLIAPIVVPPIREALGYDKPTPLNPPPVRQLIENVRK